MQLDPIIAVKSVISSSKWYQSVLGCQNMHGGSEFDILVDENGVVLLCLHKWGDLEHPTLKEQSINLSNGLILYFRTNQLEKIRNRVESLGIDIEKEIGLNPNSRRREFSLRDPDGYYLTISEYHNYEG